ncbi:MAG: 1-phosphofructokinase family hexose kinase [Cellvibrionaceae bacterium]|jgi:1-phosphofructokinase family hexose kinase
MIYTVTLNPAIDREYSVPKLNFNDVLRAGSTRNDPGGKGFNVSRMLAVLGEPSTALAFAAGKSGEWLEWNLNQSGVATNFIWVDGETRTNTTVVTSDGDDYLKVNEAGPEISAVAQAEFLACVDQLAQPDDWWVLAGSLPPGVPENFYSTLIHHLKEHKARVFLDTSGPALSAALHQLPNWIKPNAQEAQEISGHSDPVRASNWFRELFIQNTAITLGSGGVFFASDDCEWRIQSPKIVEANPIGAGDAFVGGTVFGLVQNLSPLDAVRWGVACGAMAASLSGTGFGTRPEIEKLLAKVVVSEH